MRLASLVGLSLVVAGGCAASSEVPAPMAVGPLVLREHPDGGGSAFLGSTACGDCHAGSHAKWRATGHARDYAGLPDADRSDPACLRCHVTGYGERSGYRRGGGERDLANVGCESCHGPGADHGRSARPEFVPTRTGGECPPCEVNRICRLCHTPERSPRFDLGSALAEITCKP